MTRRSNKRLPKLQLSKRQRLEAWIHENVLPPAHIDRNGLRTPHHITRRIWQTRNGVTRISHGIQCQCGKRWESR